MGGGGSEALNMKYLDMTGNCKQQGEKQHRKIVEDVSIFFDFKRDEGKR